MKAKVITTMFLINWLCVSNVDYLKVELAGMDSYGGPCYIGTGCFHRRESLTGKTYKEANKQDWKSKNVKTKTRESVDILEEACKALATCTYEQNTEWGKEVILSFFLYIYL